MYMPNLVLHTVWNVSPTVALGDNPLYKTSFDEFMGSGEEFKWMSDRIILKNKDKRIQDIVDQVKEAIIENNIQNYTKPTIEQYGQGA